MIDKKITPIYLDPQFGLYKGKPVDVRKQLLTEPVIRYWLLTLMQPGQEYTFHDLFIMVTEAHTESGGILVPTREQTAQDLDAGLDELTNWRQIGSDERKWGAGDRYRLTAGNLDVAGIEMSEAQRAEEEERPEITVGEGPQTVYAWYLPTSRQLAVLKGEEHFPMKVGYTHSNPYQRMLSHIGTAPEKPVLGFVWKTDHANHMEKWLHIELTMRHRHILPASKGELGALGQEWYRTNPEELREISKDMVARSTRKEEI